jgi:hypothetical protein
MEGSRAVANRFRVNEKGTSQLNEYSYDHDASVEQPQSRLAPKATARSHIAVASVSFACRSIHQDDGERLQLIGDRAACLINLPCGYNMAKIPCGESRA